MYMSKIYTQESDKKSLLRPFPSNNFCINKILKIDKLDEPLNLQS